MLDKLSEKILKYFINNSTNNSVSEIDTKCHDIGIDLDLLNEICQKLHKEDYIYAAFGDSGIHTVFLKHKGIVYFSEKRRDKITYFKKLLLSKWVDIAVSFITALLTSANWDKIASVLTSLFCK